ncbi:MAG: M48 family metallopeptidase [Verrucomicrobiota bacterium]
MKQIYLFSLSVILVAFVSLFQACTTVPVTGRTQLTGMVSDTEIVKQSIMQFEMMKRQWPIEHDPFMNDMLQEVGLRISEEVFWDMPLAEWEFIVFDNPNEINAFAMPGGKVGVFSAIFGLCKTEDQLAAVVAHEIAHVTARHTHEQYSQAMLNNAGGTVVGLTTGGIGSLVYGMDAQTRQAASSQRKESEADRIGIIYMARAGYDPQGAIDVMEKMVSLEGGARMTSRNASHPSSVDRLNDLLLYLDEAKIEYEKAKAARF